jgi:hypothetical protein
MEQIPEKAIISSLPPEQADEHVIELSVTKIRGMTSGCHLKCLYFW